MSNSLKKSTNRLLCVILFWVVAKALFGQGAQDTIVFGPLDTKFVIVAEFTSTTTLTDSTYRIELDHPGSTLGLGYLPTQIVAGHYVLDGFRRRYRVITNESSNFGFARLVVQELQDFNQGPSGVGLVYETVDNVDRIPIDIEDGAIGLSPALIALISQHNAINAGSGDGGSGGGGPGTISTDNTLNGDGSELDPVGLAVAAVQSIHVAGNAIALGNMQDGSVGTDEVVNGSLLAEDFAAGATDDADADPVNEAQTVTKVLNQVILSQVNGTGGGIFTDDVNDADSDPANEYNTNVALNGTDLEITDGGGTLSQDLSGIAESTNLNTLTNSNSVTIVNSSGSDAGIAAATGTDAGVMTAADRIKFDGMEPGATADQTGAEIVTEINTELGNTDWQTGGGSGGISGTIINNRVPAYDETGDTLYSSPLRIDPLRNTVAINADPTISTTDKLQVTDANIRVLRGRYYGQHAFNGQTWLEFFNVNGTRIFDIKGAGTPSDAEFNLYTSGGDRRISLRGVAGLNIWYNNTDKSVQLSQNHFADSYFGAQSFAFNNPYSSEGSNLYDRAPADWFAINNYKSYTWPRGTTAQRPTSEIGRGRYNTSTNTFELADNVGWEEIAYKSEIVEPAFGECFTSGGFVTYDLASSQVVTGLSAGDLQNFTHSAGVLTYNGSGSGKFLVSYNLSLSDVDTNTDEIITRLRINNSVSANNGGECRTIVETSGGIARTANCSGFAIIDLASGEDVRLELSSGGTPTIEVKAGTLTIIRQN